MKNKTISVLIILIVLLNSFSVASFAETPSMTAAEFNNSLCEMISEYSATQMTPSSYYLLPTNRLIVKTNSNHALVENYGAIDSVEGYKGLHVFQYSSKSIADTAYENFLKDEIEYVEYDFYFNTYEMTNIDSSKARTSEFSTWNSDVAQVEAAFDLIEEYNLKCNDIKIGIIDSGIFVQHTAFTDAETRIFDTGYAITNDKTGELCPSVVDDINHGSHVAGIIYNNTMSNVKLYPYRVFTDILYVSYVYVCGAFEFAASQGMDIINMSLGGTNRETNSDWKTLNNLIVEATNEGIVVVVAAGNNRGNSDLICPANCSSAITVAATNKQNSPDITYSASGKCVDIAAPGTKISSTVPRYYTWLDNYLDETKPYDPIPKSLFKEMSGTSMATPLVSAAAATLKSIHPEYSPADIQRIIKETAYVPDGWNTDYGVGIVNFLNMVKAEVTEVKPTITTKNGKIEITAPEGSDSRIYYTLDGTVPTIDNHIAYKEPFTVSGMNADRITAVCHENGKLIGEPVTFETTIRVDLDTLYFRHTTNPMPKEISPKSEWRSTNPNVASVDIKGNITGISPGTAHVYAYRADGIKMVYKVTVEYALWQEILIYFFFGFLWYI